jgi:uncharacterized membrane protein
MMSGAFAGALGGLAGTLAMNATQHLWTLAAGNADAPASAAGAHDGREWQERQEHRNANEVAAQAVSTGVGGERLRRDELRVAAPLVHFLFGMSAGALYGAMADGRRAHVADGLGLGVAVWAAGDELAVPLMGLSRPATERPLEMHLQSLSAHLVYGIVSEVVRGALQPRMHRNDRGRTPRRGTGVLADAGSDTRRTLGGPRGIRVTHSVTIERPLADVYRFWRRLENLPEFLEHLESVSMRDGGVWHWVARGPAGIAVEWDARIINDVENSVIAWQSLEGSRIATAGSVRFDETAHGTRVTVTLQYNPPGGKLGAAVARLLGEEPRVQVREDLRRLKQLFEAGEVPTTAGQPSGRAARRKRR